MITHSIVIPFRDKFDLMQVAVDSIPEREDIQAILVYNGKEAFPQDLIPKRQKTTITFLTSDPTKGAGHARNVGLKAVEGKYVHFLDADDYFTKEAFDAFDRYVDSEYDIVYFKPTSVFLSSGEIATRHHFYSNLVDEFLATQRDDELRYRWQGPVCKMIRTELIKNENITFEEVIVSNDARFSLTVGNHANKVFADDTIVYVITEGQAGQSLVKTRSAENMFIRYQVQIRSNKFLKSIGHYDQHVRLLGAIKVALFEFGPKEFLKYINYAIKNRVWIF